MKIKLGEGANLERIVTFQSVEISKHLNRKTNKSKGGVGNADKMLEKWLDHPVLHLDPTLSCKEGEGVMVACGKDHSISLHLQQI